jgi:hypothetical protein
MFGWLKSKGLSKVLSLFADIYREWRRKRNAERSQADFDAIERNPRRAARRMFERNDDAD